MSYRTIRRVLGETSLERKCRILFGVCLLFLIGGAFWFVNSISEELAVKNIRSRGSDLITMRLMYVHSVNREVKNNPQMDLDYVEHWSPALDLVIVAKTVKAVLVGDGAY